MNKAIQNGNSAIGNRPGASISRLRSLGVCGFVIITGGALVACSRNSSDNAEFGTLSKALATSVTIPVSHVSIQSLQFSPVTLEVKKGDIVEWKNDDLIPHTATSPEFDSGALKSGQSWRHTFTKAGDFPYICTFHPQMKGVVIVKEL
jgi:plastocyanin